MRNKLLMIFTALGIIAALASAYIHGIQTKPQPPVFSPAPNPYDKGIYANGIVESYQTNGENINIYPEVAGTVVKILANEGQAVEQGAPLVMLDDTMQRAVVEQQKSQSEAALALLEELKAQPRKENLEVAKAQLDLAEANLRTAQDQWDKQRRSYELDPKSVSKDALDTAENAVKVAKANVGVAQRQYDLTKAGSWVYDVRNQQKQYEALTKAYVASSTLLGKYTIKAPTSGVVLSINTAVGSFVSTQGVYDTYTQGMNPVITMGGIDNYMGVRCYIDEILLQRLPKGLQMKAQMFIRGTDIHIPLEFVRVQPYVSPKVELSSERTERVDVRVLPVIFRFPKPKDIYMYPGQLVDVYIMEN
ncbi:MAG TPA: efflux RND transporter periplasmic adaptor subunit [Burkholderiales bacterium]|nr:efflux RND transporter periplasmic adaptor subunit [Burkholderiales bacterium]